MNWLLYALLAGAGLWLLYGIVRGLLCLIVVRVIIRYARWNSNLTISDSVSNMWDETGD